jgi:hypothetical protein
LKDNKMLAAVLIIVIVLAVAFIVWKVMAGKRAPAGAEGGKGGAAPVELKPGTMPRQAKRRLQEVGKYAVARSCVRATVRRPKDAQG